MKAGTRDKWLVGCAIVTALAAVVSAWTYVAGRKDVSIAQEESAFNKRVDGRLSLQLDPVTKLLSGLNSRLDKFEGWKEGIGSDVRIFKEKQAEGLRQNSELRARVEQQASISRIDNPGRVLAIIRGEVDVAERSARVMPEVQLVDYKRAIIGLPQTTPLYWETAQAVVNYESLLLQMRGLVPDPAKVAKPCGALTNEPSQHITSSNNVFSGRFVFSECIVDLDTQVFVGAVFRNSVIRSRGGSFVLHNVVFINCRFVLELPANQPRKTPEQRLLMAIISAPAQNNVTVTTG